MPFAFKGEPKPPPELYVTVREVRETEGWVTPKGCPPVVAAITYGGITVATIQKDGSIAPATGLSNAEVAKLKTYDLHVTQHDGIGIRNYRDRLLK